LKRIEPAGIFTLFLALAFVMTWPLGLKLFSHMPAPSRDCLLNCWILSTEISHLASTGASFWDGGIFHPSKGTLTYSEHLVGYLPFAWLLFSWTKSMACSVNILTIISFAIAGLGMFLLVRHLTGNPWASFLAGALYGFSPFRISHINHLNILAMHWLPFILLFWHRALERRRFTDYGGFVFFFVLEGLSCVQLSMSLFVLLPLLTIMETIRLKEPARALWHWGAAYGCVALVLIPFFLPYYGTLHALGMLNTPYPDWSASIISFFTPPGALRLWGWLTPILGKGQDVETYLFPGITILCLAYAGLRSFASGTEKPCGAAGGGSPFIFRLMDLMIAASLVLILAITLTGGLSFMAGPFPVSVRSPSILSTFAATLIALRIFLDRKMRESAKHFLQSLPPHVSFYCILVIIGVVFTFYGPFVLLGKLFPPLASIRVSSRVFTIALTGLCVLAGYGFVALAKKQRRPPALAAALIVLVLIESCPVPLLLSPLPGTTIARTLQTVPAGSVVMLLPLKDDELNAGYMYSAAGHGIQLVNGYSGITPRYYEALDEALGDFPSDRSKGALVQFKVGHVLLDRTKIPGERLRAIEEGLQRDGDFSLLSGGRDAALYRFNPGTQGLKPVQARLLTPVDRKNWKISAEPDKKLVEHSGAMTDGVVKTYWTTGRPVRKGDHISVDMGASHTLSGIALFHGTDFSFYLKTYQLHLSLDGMKWTMVARGWCDPPQFETYFRDPGNPYFFIPFNPREGRHIRIRSIDQGNYPWTVHEIRAYSPWRKEEKGEALLVDPWRQELPLLKEEE